MTFELKVWGDSDLLGNVAHLKTAIIQLLELTACKVPLSLHMDITTALFKQIKSHRLDKLFSTEKAINKQAVATVPKYLCLLKNRVKGKVRISMGMVWVSCIFDVALHHAIQTSL